MPRLFGRDYTAAELAGRVGRLDQVAGVCAYRFDDGRAQGVRAFDVRSGAGLRFISVADRALDVCALECNGIPLVWHGPGGVAAPQYYQPADNGSFEQNFFGGLFTTCGLGNFGPGGTDDFGTFGMHGRVNHLPARNVTSRASWKGDDCFYELCGTIDEAQMFGANFSLERRLRVELGTNRLTVNDVVTNRGGTRRPHMILYHCNMGFPLLDADASLEVSHRSMRARDEAAQRGLERWNRGGQPDAQFAEQVFIHEPAACDDGLARAMMVNRTLGNQGGMALVTTYDPAQLPALFTWRMLGTTTYVMGIEPANSPTIEGRIQAGVDGTLPFLDPDESRSYDLSFEVLTDTAKIDQTLALIHGTHSRPNHNELKTD